jgi:hypothetical protein
MLDKLKNRKIKKMDLTERFEELYRIELEKLEKKENENEK